MKAYWKELQDICVPPKLPFFFKMPVFLYSMTKQKLCKYLPFDSEKTIEIQQREVKEA